MLYSGIHYVSPSGDFCLKLRVLNLQKFEKKLSKWKQWTKILNQKLKSSTDFENKVKN